jgi:hypothetical protein
LKNGKLFSFPDYTGSAVPSQNAIAASTWLPKSEKP